MRIIYLGFFLGFLFLFSGCTGLHKNKQAQVPILFPEKPEFGSRPDIPSYDQLFSLNDDHKEKFLKYFHSEDNQDIPAYVRVFDYLEDSTLSFNYKGQTLRAERAMEDTEGNCMTLAILTTAIANLGGVRVGYQLIDSTPVFDKKDEVIIRGVHVRTMLYRDDHSGSNTLFPSGMGGMIVDYFPGDQSNFIGNLSNNEFVARFYRNVAVEKLQEQNVGGAYWYLKESLKFAPYDDEAINIMGVIYRRVGDLGYAEKIYKHGIEHASHKLLLYKNYHALLDFQERADEAEVIKNKINKYTDDNPYIWLKSARISLKKGDIKSAERDFKKSIELAPYIQYGYLGLAKIYFSKGKYKKSKKMLLLAMENNTSRANYVLYKTKLQALNSKHKWEIETRPQLGSPEVPSLNQ